MRKKGAGQQQKVLQAPAPGAREFLHGSRGSADRPQIRSSEKELPAKARILKMKGRRERKAAAKDKELQPFRTEKTASWPPTGCASVPSEPQVGKDSVWPRPLCANTGVNGALASWLPLRHASEEEPLKAFARLHDADSSSSSSSSSEYLMLKIRRKTKRQSLVPKLK